MIFVCATTCKVRGTYFFLAQTEQGDIFRITLEKEEGEITEIQLKYFTTIHVASALCFLKKGYLFVASEVGNHYLYRITGLGDNEPEFSSSVGLDQTDTFFFLPKARKNLLLVTELQSISPIMHFEMVQPKQEERPYLCIACGCRTTSTLRILKRRTKNSKNKLFKQISTNLLEFTARKFVSIPANSYVILIETEHNAYTLETKELKKSYILKRVSSAAEKYNALFNNTKRLHMDVSRLLWKQFEGNIPDIYQCESGMWASSVRMLFVQKMTDFQTNFQGQTSEVFSIYIYSEQLEQNEAAFSMCLVKFASQGDVQYLLIGVNSVPMDPNIEHTGRIYTYKVLDTKLELVHKTVVEDCPTAMCPFQGCVLIGIGGVLKLYDFSKIMLFVRYERNLCNRIISIHNSTGDNRICVGDVKDGFLYLLYKPECVEKNSWDEKIIELFAEDIDPTWITTSCFWGSDKLAKADKFGNIFVVRLPSESPSKEYDIHALIKEFSPEEYPKKDKNLKKAEILATFHVGEMVCSMQVGKFYSQSKSEVLVYATISGSIGILAPLDKDDRAATLLYLEMLMRVTNPPLCGGDHLAYRSCYYPIVDVIDGDLLELYYTLSCEDTRRIDGHIGCSAIEIMQKLRLKYLGEERAIPVKKSVPNSRINDPSTSSNMPGTSAMPSFSRIPDVPKIPETPKIDNPFIMTYSPKQFPFKNCILPCFDVGRHNLFLSMAQQQDKVVEDTETDP